MLKILKVLFADCIWSSYHFSKFSKCTCDLCYLFSQLQRPVKESDWDLPYYSVIVYAFYFTLGLPVEAWFLFCFVCFAFFTIVCDFCFFFTYSCYGCPSFVCHVQQLVDPSLHLRNNQIWFTKLVVKQWCILQSKWLYPFPRMEARGFLVIFTSII